MPVDWNHIPRVIAALHNGAVVGVRTAAQKIERVADDTVPVDTGFLRATSYVASSDASSYFQATGAAQRIDEFRALLPEVPLPAEEAAAVVAYAASYALFVHDGTRHMPARPWLKEAADSVDVGREIAGALRAAIVAAAL